MPDKDTQWFLRPHHIQSVTNHPKSLVDDLCAINHMDQIREMYKNKELEETQEANDANTFKELKFKREYDKIDDEVERNKRKIIDGINTYAINESVKVQNEIGKSLEMYKTRMRELEQNPQIKEGSTNFMEFKSFYGGGERADALLDVSKIKES